MLRKNISKEKAFNLVFATAGVSLFSARLIFVILNFNSGFLHPLNFILFPYFPGLSFAGAIIGGAIYLLIFAKEEKLPVLHLLDCFSVPLVSAIPVGLFLNLFNSKLNLKSVFFYFSIIQVFIYIIFFAIFYNSFQKVKLKEGTLSFLVIVMFSSLSLISIFLKEYEEKTSFKNPEIYPMILVLLASLLLLIKEQAILIRIKNYIFEKYKWNRK